VHRTDASLAVAKGGMARGRWRRIYLLEVVLDERVRVPLTCPLQIVNFLLLFSHVELYEFNEVLVAA